MKRIIVILMLILVNIKSYTPQDCTTNIEEIRKQYIIAHEKNKRIEGLLLTIKTIESGGDYFAKGRSGEFGAYQFMPNTWEYWSLKFFDEVLDIRVEENQDRVAYKKIEMLVDKGYSNEEVASFWNSGRRNWQGRTGVNRFGINYCTPTYVNQFINVLYRVL